MYRSDDPVQDAIKYINDCDKSKTVELNRCEGCFDDVEDELETIEINGLKTKCCKFCVEISKEYESMETKTIELNSGIVIKDSRSLGCGIMIKNQNTKYMTLGYSSQNGFYLNMKGLWITMDDYQEYYKELDMMRLSLVEANQILVH